jgi:hypothetical protein
MAYEGQQSVYEAEYEEFLEQAQIRGLFSEADVHRLRAAYRATAANPRRGLASILPRLLLAEEASSDRAVARWSLYETIREQTRDSLVGVAA